MIMKRLTVLVTLLSLLSVGCGSDPCEQDSLEPRAQEHVKGVVIFEDTIFKRSDIEIVRDVVWSVLEQSYPTVAEDTAAWGYHIVVQRTLIDTNGEYIDSRLYDSGLLVFTPNDPCVARTGLVHQLLHVAALTYGLGRLHSTQPFALEEAAWVAATEAMGCPGIP